MRVIRQARREAQLKIAGPAEVLDAAARHRDSVAHETLATAVELTESSEALGNGFFGEVGNRLEISVRVARTG